MPPHLEALSRNHLLECHRVIIRQHSILMLDLSTIMLYDVGHPYDVICLGSYHGPLLPFLLEEVTFGWLIISHLAFLILHLLEEHT